MCILFSQIAKKKSGVPIYCPNELPELRHLIAETELTNLNAKDMLTLPSITSPGNN